MGVALVNDTLETPIEEIVERAKAAAALIKVNSIMKKKTF
jgi:phosphoribosylglycinamide formyltransferase 2